MKRFLVAAVAAIALLGFVGCDTPTSSSDTGTPAAAKVWKVKGSWDWGTATALKVDELNPKSLTYVIDNLYDLGTPTEFVLINPAGTEVKFPGVTTSGAVAITGIVGGFGTNIGFTATKKSYTLVVDITNATPDVSLIAGTDPALPLTNALLADRLKIKGNAFSIGWTETAGTFDSLTNTVSWDVTVNNKNGEFGFQAFEGFIKKELDVATLTVAGNSLAPVEVLSTGSGQKLLNPSKDSSVYTFAVVVDSTKTVGSGRYMLTVTLKTVGASNWAFAPWANLYLAGAGTEFGSWTAGSFIPVTVTAGTGTKQITATSTGAAEFKIVQANTWGTDIGFGGIDVGAGSLALSSVGGNISFAAVSGTTYTITVDFTTANYIANGVPTVKVVTP